ncbi:MAG TPA: UDP-glucose--hexose-1-phosphate uridylyltransferase [Terriglobales bacterium]|nr:UDP-glucose--hexose-1-phosphate uridylyltransferase [Terriglobales bacterium]
MGSRCADEGVRATRATMDLKNTPHRRFNPLTREWVLVSPHRTVRPWTGQVEQPPEAKVLRYDPECYLCPGNARHGGARTPSYEGTFVFDNDYPAMLPETGDAALDRDGLMVARAERGLCRVLCFSPRHDLTVATLSTEDLRRVVQVWTEQYREIGELPWARYVLIFENRGVMMGASNPHPHCQIWANATLPNEAAAEQAAQLQHMQTRRSCLLCDYLRLEQTQRERLVCENQSFAALVPFWAVWPFEIMVISKRHTGGMDDLGAGERDALADILQQVTRRYDNLFGVTVPYSMGFHQRPTDGEPHPEWHFHAHYYPPLLRSATVRKWMVGYEMLGSPQRDLTPEVAAERLRTT